MTHKAVGFDRRIGDIDFDTLDRPTTGTLPIRIEGVPPATARRPPATPHTDPARPRGSTVIGWEPCSAAPP
jgi:hypothetical protein